MYLLMSEILVKKCCSEICKTLLIFIVFIEFLFIKKYMNYSLKSLNKIDYKIIRCAYFKMTLNVLDFLFLFLSCNLYSIGIITIISLSNLPYFYLFEPFKVIVFMFVSNFSVEPFNLNHI